MEIEPSDPQMDGDSMNLSVMALSGGMDSTCLLLRLIAEGDEVIALSFRYGQRHVLELECAERTVLMLQERGHSIEHRILDLEDAMGRFSNALTDHATPMPEGHYEEFGMRSTVVPNRNAIFASLLYGTALDHIDREGHVRVSLGVHSGDHAIYPDCRPEFYLALEQAFRIGNWGAEDLAFHLPYIEMDKERILQDALTNCGSLGLEFDEVLRNTLTSYDPDGTGRSNGRTGSDVERILAFHAIGRKDPIEYQTSWEDVLEHALELKEAWVDE